MPSARSDTKQHKKGEGCSLEGRAAPMKESLSRMFDPKLLPSRREPERRTGTAELFRALEEAGRRSSEVAQVIKQALSEAQS